jgi:serine O-acetyltransferase
VDRLPADQPAWPLLKLIRADVQATTHPNFRLYGTRRFWMRVAAKVVLSANVRAVITFRIAHALARKGYLPLALVLRARILRVSAAELNPQAKIGPGLYLVHAVGVAIGAFVEIGDNCTIYHGATIGPQRAGTQGAHEYTKIGNNVTVGTHAVVMGGVTVGDGAVIGANAVVTSDVAAGSVVGGVPARALPVRERTADGGNG